MDVDGRRTPVLISLPNGARVLLMQYRSSFESLETDVVGLLGSVDVSCLTRDEASSLMHFSNSLARKLSAFSSLCGARAVELNAHVVSGSRSAETWLASEVGIPVGQARCVLSTVESLSSLPDVESAYVSGELSVEQTAEVVRAGVVDPASQAALLNAAKSKSFYGLRKVCSTTASRSGSEERV